MNKLATDSVGVKARIDLYKFNHRVDHELYDLLSDTKRLINEKDRLIHSLAHALLECSQCMEDMGRDSQNIILAEEALDSITDKGEKNE